jgi:hypothetical protein
MSTLKRYLDPRRYVRALRRAREEARVHRGRRTVERAYRARPVGATRRGARVVVCEGMWDNPNHFFRLHLMLSAMPDIGECRLIGILRRRSERAQRRSLAALGVSEFVYLEEHSVSAEAFAAEARRLLSGVRRHRDLVDLPLPHRLPAYIYYDTVVKQTRHPQPPLDLPLWHRALAELLRNLEIYRRLFAQHDIVRVVTSHPWKSEYAALVWTSLVHDVVSYYVTGFCDSTRIRRFSGLSDFATPIEHGTSKEYDALPLGTQRRLVDYGAAYLAERDRGTSTDINARYAFHPERRHAERATARQALGLPSDRPVAAVFTQAWFDFPHTFGMQNFTDFLDWIRCTAARVAENTAVSWLLKPHPCDDWYGGVRLRDLVGTLPPHVRICAEDTDSVTARVAADAIVTVHGTIGIEAAARGLPVVNADRSQYTDWGFTHLATSREHYAALLAGIGDLAPPTPAQRDRAMAFAALSLAPPPAELGLLRPSCDTSDPPVLYREIAARFRNGDPGWERERRAIGEWLASGHPCYAAYQTTRACADE